VLSVVTVVLSVANIIPLRLYIRMNSMFFVLQTLVEGGREHFMVN